MLHDWKILLCWHLHSDKDVSDRCDCAAAAFFIFQIETFGHREIDSFRTYWFDVCFVKIIMFEVINWMKSNQCREEGPRIMRSLSNNWKYSMHIYNVCVNCSQNITMNSLVTWMTVNIYHVFGEVLSYCLQRTFSLWCQNRKKSTCKF